MDHWFAWTYDVGKPRQTVDLLTEVTELCGLKFIIGVCFILFESMNWRRTLDEIARRLILGLIVHWCG
jgi:hypothetical protein